MIHRFLPLAFTALAFVANAIESPAGPDSLPAALQLAKNEEGGSATSSAKPGSEKEHRRSFVTNIIVREFRFDGNTVYSDEVLSQVTAPYVNRPVTLDDLEEARRAITLKYVTNGYVNSGAVLPDQSVRDGIVTYRIK